jgi:hypothetical protein
MAAPALPSLLSSDGHLEVRPERWTPRLPAKYRERAPRTVTLPDGGDAILVEGQPPYPAPFLDLRAGRTSETWQPFGATVDDTAGVGPPEQRLREQDMDGLLAEVLFPNMQVGPRLWRAMTDDDLYRATVRAYNDWLGEEYSYPTPGDDRFWAAAIDMQMPLTVHVAFDRLGPRASQPTFEYPGADPAVLAKVGPRKLVEWVALPFLGTAPALSLSQLVLSGVFDRLPDLQIFFAGTRLGWVPFWLEEADYWYERHRHWAERLLGFKPPAQRPSDYVRQHIHFSVQHVERVAIELRHHLGPRHIMFATDFPHIECDWPNTRPFAERLLAGVPAGEAYRIAAGNTLDFFHPGDTPMGRTARASAAATAG